MDTVFSRIKWTLEDGLEIMVKIKMMVSFILGPKRHKTLGRLKEVFG